MAKSGLPAWSPVPDSVDCNVTSLQQGYDYHLHISHSDEDEDLFRHIKTQLENKGYKIFIHMPGESLFSENMDKCYKILAVISKSYMSSTWHEFETANYITKGADISKRVRIPILHNIEPSEVPSYVKEVNYLQTREEHFWKRLIMALDEDVSVSATIPIVDIANGLAWAYYYGYLALVLPSLEDRIKNSMFAQQGKIFTKMIILMPKSGFCAKDVKEVDTNFTSAGFVKKEIARSAVHKRDYGNAVLKMVHPDSGEERFVVMEYATPIWTMYEMEMGRMARLGPQEKEQEMSDFQKKLTEILEHENCKACHNKYILLPYNDGPEEVKEDPHYLSRLVSQKIASELSD